jgi:hypothetical protein
LSVFDELTWSAGFFTLSQRSCLCPHVLAPKLLP